MINIVLVDDETDMFPVFNVKFKREIRDGKVKFHFFTSAQDALEFVSESKGDKFDYIISDINMPAMTGFDLASQIKKDNSKQKVVLISSTNLEESKDYDPDIGIDGYVHKPINFDELKRLLLDREKK